MKINKLQRTLLRIMILMLIVTVLLFSFVVGKYIKTISVKNTVTFTANLAENVMLVESKVQRQPDGSYETIDATITGETQTYTLVPGQDIPKDPRIIIEGKTDVPAYLYVEIVDTLDTVNVNGDNVKLIDYSIASTWEFADQSLNKHGGTVYKYTGAALTSANIPEGPIGILNGNKVTVSQYVKSHDLTNEQAQDSLTFYVYLIETT